MIVAWQQKSGLLRFARNDDVFSIKNSLHSEVFIQQSPSCGDRPIR